MTVVDSRGRFGEFGGRFVPWLRRSNSASLMET